jgi:hypothetical protein
MFSDDDDDDDEEEEEKEDKESRLQFWLSFANHCHHIEITNYCEIVCMISYFRAENFFT